MNQTPSILFMSQRSPFARRIRLAFRRLKLPCDEKTVDVFQTNPELLQMNPLGMVPTVLTPEGLAISDSANVLEYFHDKTGAIWPLDFLTRTQVRQASVLAMGVIQSSVLYFQEIMMHEAPSPFWVSEHFESIERTLQMISSLPKDLWIQNQNLTQAGWDLAVALEYCEIRIPSLDWKKSHPSFIPLLELAQKNSDFLETKPKL